MKHINTNRVLQSFLLVAVIAFTGPPVGAEESDEVLYIEEVIVTAQRRGAESLQNVPMSVSVISSETIDKSGLLQMDDFLRALPSTSFLERGAGRNNVIIRGIAADPQFDDAVGVYIGDIPVSKTANNGNPDLRLVDIQRIEVLRGPQGTLYGDGSMGGTVKVIPAPPNLSAREVMFTGSYGSTEGTGGNNSTIEAVLNLPLVKDGSALRLVAYRHDFSGYINNIAGSDPEKQYWAEEYGGLAVDKDHAGTSDYTGGRLQFLWQLSSNLKLTLMALTQDVDQMGLPEAELDHGDFQQARFLKRDGSQESLVMNFDLANALIEYDFTGNSLLSSTSWMKSKSSYDRDVGVFEIPYLGDVPEFQLYDHRFDTWVQEFRLVSRTSRRFHYLLGLFYQDLSSTIFHKITFEGDPMLDPYNGEVLLDSVGNWDEEQLALFGNFSYDFTDQLSASFGARFFKYDQQVHWDGYGIFLGGHDVQGSNNEDDGTTLDFNVDYIINDSTMIYGRFAQGFRLGRPVGDLPDHCDADGDGLLDGLGIPQPTSIAPDELDSLEAGTKLSLAGGRLQLNAALFAVKWDGIPIWVIPTSCGWGIQINAGKAKSWGAEIEGIWAITPRVRANFAASWVDPELAEDSPGLGSEGDRLPGTPRFNASLGIQGDFNISERPAFVRADLVYVGEYYNNLQQEGLAAGGYTTLGLRGGVSLGHFQLEAYVNNATDEFARTWIDIDVGAGGNYVLRPRTVGLLVRYSLDKR